MNFLLEQNIEAYNWKILPIFPLKFQRLYLDCVCERGGGRTAANSFGSFLLERINDCILHGQRIVLLVTSVRME